MESCLEVKIPSSKLSFFGKLVACMSYRFSRMGQKNDNSEFPSKYFFFVLKICLRYFFHNFKNGDNLEADSPIIRNILSYCFYSAKNDNSELGTFYDA